MLDGANIALFGQNFDAGGFVFAQVEASLTELHSEGLGKRPLLVCCRLVHCHIVIITCGHTCHCLRAAV